MTTLRELLTRAYDEVNDIPADLPGELVGAALQRALASYPETVEVLAAALREAEDADEAEGHGPTCHEPWEYRIAAALLRELTGEPE